MSKLRVQITMSLDGYVAGPNQSLDHPMGVGAEHLHDWAFKLKLFHEMFGMEGGETGVDNDIAIEAMSGFGAEIMGRNMFGGGPGGWGDGSWKGWWGDNPPYHTPVFVLTHYPREPLVMEGGTTFYFVTEGIEAAYERAKAAAGDLDIAVAGGAKAVQQYLAAGLVDELELHLVPQILGGGERLLDNVGGANLRLEHLRTVAGPDAVHVKYRVLR